MSRKHFLKRRAVTLFIALFAFLMCSAQAFAQSKISGSVSDGKGEALIGVNVLVKGTTIGTITDVEGKFTITASPKDVIQISYIGYTTQQIAVGNKKSFNVVLAEDSKTLEEVVVVGYGTQKKSDFTGSLTTVGGDKIVDSHKQSAAAALQGTIAGVDIVRNGNNPGAGFNIMIRGQNTIASGSTTGNMNDINPPLYVVDGMMLTSISDIAPDDIERIDVLKDASSTAIYGSRGANGVVIITTKKGSPTKEKSYVEYNGFVSFTSATHLPDMMNGQQWADYKVQRYMGSNWKNYMNGEAEPTYEKVLTTQQYNNLMDGNSVDWVDELLGTAVSQNHAVRVYGNGKGLTYSFGAGYTDEKGITGVDDYKRYNFSASVDKELSSKLKSGINIYTAYTKTVQSNETVRQAYRLNPLCDEYNEDGSLRTFPDDNLSNVSNPLVESENNQTHTLGLHAFGNIYLQYKPVEWITIKTAFSPDAYFERVGSYYGKNSKGGKGSATNAQAQYNTSNYLTYTWTNTMNAEKTFGDHSLGLLLGTEWVKNVKDGLNTKVKNFATDSYTFYNMGAAGNKSLSDLISSYYTQDQWMSTFARANYSYKGKYLVTATGRYDGSSRLAAGHRWKFFPSAALGWRISEEEFMKKYNWVNNLKLRLSYGVSGNNNVDPYATQATISNNYYVFGTSGTAASTISTLANTSLSWETTKEWNYGLDFGFFNGRISGSLDYYQRRTNNILMNRVLSQMNGYGSVMDNVGVVDNRGLEAGLTTVNIKTKDFTWTSNFNFTTNHNEIKELSDGATRDEANQWFVGKSVGTVWNYQAVGYWNVGDNGYDQAVKQGLAPGSIKVKEVDTPDDYDNWVTTSADKVFLGSRFPSWTGGVTNTFNYKNWSLAIFVYTRQGQWSYSQFHWTGARDDNAAFNHMNLRYWSAENPNNAEWYRPGLSNPGQIDALLWQKTSFTKVGHITLGYDLPKGALSKLNLSKCHLYVSCQNPFVFTDYKGMDPEAASNGTDSAYFMTRSLELGLNLTF